MAQSSTATLSWNANNESDLAGYNVYYTLYPGVYPVTQVIQLGLLLNTVMTASTYFPSDGLWYFALSARDASGNLSPKTTAVSKRIVQVTGGLVRRR